ncbi:helix-turn-helix domain-containing protein [Candidatus Enterococcus murrayae]|uniref:Helix-turn-helix domain-containing protein n=1 Tax=Candidatus Enterococcus murrayae TaxID=2815321 RepID=A0ABS3HEG3_9ENTE|nr:helix-turn-helix domain-containing protein [Enterococcus sp. MJM16]MBO0451837.1 helix-turn-helix domain-containing protein [Enterococcus sp. MJM16]
MIHLNNFLGNESVKELELLRVLYKNPRFIDVEELSTQLKMNRHSIYKYFDLLQNTPYIEENRSKEILLAKRGQGYKFTGTKKDYKIIYQQVIQTNPFFKLVELLLQNNEINIIKFTHDNFISESKVRKRLYELKPLFEDIGLSLKRRDGNVLLRGDEAKIRFFAVAFFWNIYHGSYWPFPGISEKKCEELVANIFAKNTINYNDIGLKLTCYVFAVTILRFRKGFRIEEKKIDSIKHSPYIAKNLLAIILSTDSDFNTVLLEELHSKYLLDRTEIYFLILWFYSNSNFYLLNSKLVHFLDKAPAELLPYPNPFSELLKDSNHFSDFDTFSTNTKQSFLSTILAGCLSVELFSKTSFTVTGYEVEKYITKHFPKLLFHTTNLLAQSAVYPDDPDKRQGLALTFAIASTLIESPSKFAKKIRIKVETDLPTVLEFFVIERIKSTFQSFYNLEISNSIAYQNADFCISTNFLSESDSFVETLLIDAQVTLSDILTINQKILQILDA